MRDALERLYDDDYVAWLEATADHIRQGNFTAINTDHLADELVALARLHKDKAAGLSTQIVLHLLKLDMWDAVSEGTRRHWASELDTWRNQLGYRVTTNVRHHLATQMPSMYAKAARMYVKVITREVDPRKGGARQPPTSCPYTLEQVLDEDFYGSYSGQFKE